MIPREKLTGGGDQYTSGSRFRYKKKKEKKRKHARLTVLHDLLLQQTELQSFKSNTRIVFGNSPLLACA